MLLAQTIGQLGWGVADVDLRRHLAPQQLAPIDSVAMVRALIGTRRAGKTETVASMCHLYPLPGTTGVFIAPTASKAVDLLRPKLFKMKQDLGLDFEWNGSSNTATFPNGGKVKCRGLSSGPDVDLLRGDNPPFAIIEEAGHADQARLEEAVREALLPSLADYRNKGGRGLVMAGTPSADAKCFWAKTCLGTEGGIEAEVFRLSILDNPFFGPGEAAQIIEDELRRNGWTRETPAFRREWLGEFVPDATGLCFPSWRNRVQLLPQNMAPMGQGRMVMGVDFGLRDPNAWVLVVVVGPQLHYVKAYQQNNMNHADIAAKTRELRADWQAGYCVGDGNGRGSQDIKTLVEQYAVPIEAVKYPTHEKAPRIDAFESIVASGNVFVYEEAKELWEEASVLPWDDARKHPRKGYRDHLVDAGLIASHQARQFLQAPVDETPEERDAKARRARVQAQLRASGARKSGSW